MHISRDCATCIADWVVSWKAREAHLVLVRLHCQWSSSACTTDRSALQHCLFFLLLSSLTCPIVTTALPFFHCNIALIFTVTSAYFHYYLVLLALLSMPYCLNFHCYLPLLACLNYMYYSAVSMRWEWTCLPLVPCPMRQRCCSSPGCPWWTALARTQSQTCGPSRLRLPEPPILATKVLIKSWSTMCIQVNVTAGEIGVVCSDVGSVVAF